MTLTACSGSDTVGVDDPRAPPGDAGASTGTGTDGGADRLGKVDGGGTSNEAGQVTDAASPGALNPPAGTSSKGSGGAAPVAGAPVSVQNVTYLLVVPESYANAPTPLLVVFSGTEGGATMTQNLMSLGPMTQTASFVRVVLDGVTYNGNGQAGAIALDDVRAKYNIDNDRTYLMGESAGTTAALALGFHLRQSSFAAYWANDVTASDAPAKNATQLGFAPWGQAGPGGDLGDATAIVTAMKAAGYRVPNPAPYAGPGATQHGSPDQFIAGLTWLVGKTR